MCDVIDSLEETWLRFDDSEVPDNRFDEDTCDLVSPFFHHLTIRFDVVEWDGDDFFGSGFRHTC